MRTLILVTTLLLLTACSKLSNENYDKLKAGMSQEEVQSILGSPSACTDSIATKCTWGDENGKHISVSFVADKAVGFSKKDL
ncbi:MAG: outer membrane protein assembly factor BamE [Gammaproteobacteria bacterium]|nr:outer membrane protein assembly factor BamE [Gammaproteobacteria bacterium]NNJ72750.1 outer membrane protein assembly factor BamE [Enterobacterales bacterium]